MTDPVAEARRTGQVLRCEPNGSDAVEFLHVEFVGAPGGQWIKTFEDWDESHTLEESGVRYVFNLCDPAFELVPEEESHFAELADEPPVDAQGYDA